MTAIRRQTQIAFSADDEAERMRALTELAGVGIPVASTLLHFAFPGVYRILDWRARVAGTEEPVDVFDGLARAAIDSYDRAW